VTPALAAGLGLGLASALALASGFLLQQGAVSRIVQLSLRRPLAAARALLDSRRWIGGFSLGLAGWALYFAALTLAPLSLVQTVAAGGIGLLVILVALAERTLPVRRERVGALLATTGLVALAAGAGRSGTTTSSAPSTAGLCALAAAALLIVACALRRRSAGLGGLAAGLCYGVGDVTTKSLLIALPHHPTATALLSAPLLYATAGAHGLGFVVLQRAFLHGGAIASLGPMTAATNLLPMAAGVLLLGERLPSGGLGLALRLFAFAAAVAGAWVLAARGVPSAPPETPVEPARWLQPSLPTAAR
jgi:hypothetical protein